MCGRAGIQFAEKSYYIHFNTFFSSYFREIRICRRKNQMSLFTRSCWVRSWNMSTLTLRWIPPLRSSKAAKLYVVPGWRRVLIKAFVIAAWPLGTPNGNRGSNLIRPCLLGSLHFVHVWEIELFDILIHFWAENCAAQYVISYISKGFIAAVGGLGSRCEFFFPLPHSCLDLLREREKKKRKPHFHFLAVFKARDDLNEMLISLV